MGKTLTLVIGGDLKPCGTLGAQKRPRRSGAKEWQEESYLFFSIYTVVTFAACRPLGPWTTSNRTA